MPPPALTPRQVQTQRYYQGIEEQLRALRDRSQLQAKVKSRTALGRVGSEGAVIGPRDSYRTGPHTRALATRRGAGGTTHPGGQSIPAIDFAHGLEDRLPGKGLLGVWGGLSATSVNQDAGNMSNMMPLMHGAGAAPAYGAGPFQTYLGGPATNASMARLNQPAQGAGMNRP